MARDRYRYFRVEARQLLDELTSGALELGDEPGSELVRKLLRAAHTLKGAARVVGQVAMAEQAHELEDLLEPLRNGDRTTTPPELTDACLRLLDSIRQGLEALDGPQGRSTPAEQQASDPAPAAQPPQARGLRVVGVEVDELDRLLEGILEATATTAALSRELSALGESSGERSERRVAAPWPSAAVPRHRGALRFAKAGASARDLGRSLEAIRRRTQEQIETLDRELEELRRQTIELRLVPVEAVFGDLERAVRDAARETGREVQLVSRGGETRLDAHVLAGLRGALTHLVRNAVVHGIEDASTRAAADKPVTGTVEVVFTRRGQRAEITCRDDGSGLARRHPLSRA